ncbi:galectin-related protein-like [Protopterus annectens]|uniref:galectin-related protein-like n=1 Tax=Protopterus annectens TaxID=7888 RepID=UPI001CFBB893|nr:galectin-related protein-like [Protopterus annectens]
MAENGICENADVYKGAIPGGMKPAMKIVIIGLVQSNPKRFTVTLGNSTEQEVDIGFQLEVNFQEKVAIRNAKISGKWGLQEKNIPYFPFSPGDTFKMEIICEHQCLRVLVDRQKLCDFAHRVDMQTLTVLKINGDVQLTKVA